MGYITTQHGEEQTVKSGLQLTYDYGLYNDSVDLLARGDTDPDTDITTEPTGAEYARQQVVIGSTNTAEYDGNWGYRVEVSFDTSDSTEDVDGVFAVESALIHHSAGPFSQVRDLSQIDILDVTITVVVQ